MLAAGAAADRDAALRTVDVLRADVDAAHARSAQLAAQVSDLASALAALGAGKPAVPAAR